MFAGLGEVGPKKNSMPRHSSFEQICQVAEKERDKLYASMSQPSSPTEKHSFEGKPLLIGNWPEEHCGSWVRWYLAEILLILRKTLSNQSVYKISILKIQVNSKGCTNHSEIKMLIISKLFVTKANIDFEASLTTSAKNSSLQCVAFKRYLPSLWIYLKNSLKSSLPIEQWEGYWLLTGV